MIAASILDKGTTMSKKTAEQRTESKRPVELKDEDLDKAQGGAEIASSSDSASGMATGHRAHEPPTFETPIGKG